MKYSHVDIIKEEDLLIGYEYCIVLWPKAGGVGYYLLKNDTESQENIREVYAKFPKSYREAVGLIKKNYKVKNSVMYSVSAIKSFDIICKKEQIV